MSVLARASVKPLALVHKKIKLREQKPEIANLISEKLSLSSVTANALAARGYKVDKDLENFLNPTLKNGIPAANTLKNLEAACLLIERMVGAGHAIAICCDFDVDGLSGGSQIQAFLKSINAKSKVFVPCRFSEGYGLSEKAIRQIAKDGFSLLITVDFGTTNEKELRLAKDLGLKTIVIDHHHVGNHRPPADVFINPCQEDCGFAGKTLSAAGLAWYLICGMKSFTKLASKVDPKQFLDLACLGTICDMVPLVGVNRVIARRGLELLAQTTRPGLQALIKVMGAKGGMGCSDVSFGIGPRINAAGRMVHGEVVIDLLTTTDQEIAYRIAHQLDSLNKERKEAEDQVKEKALAQFNGLSKLPAALIAWDANFHTGVLGIVAQRLVESFYRPSIVMGADSKGVFKGSVRGIKGFNVVETLAAAGKSLIKFGGHEGAGGFTVKESNLENFSADFTAETENRIKDLETQPVVSADTEVMLDQVDQKLISELEKFAPFGMGNPSPQLLAKNVKINSIRELKGGHLKATFSQAKRQITGVIWRTPNHPAIFHDAVVNIAFKPEINAFNGNQEIQLNIQAVELA